MLLLLYRSGASGSAVTGELSAVDAADSAEFIGSHDIPAVSGSLAATDGADSSQFDGYVTALSPVSGTFDAVDGADLASFSGSQSIPPVTGDLAATDGPDSAEFFGTGGENVSGGGKASRRRRYVIRDREYLLTETELEAMLESLLADSQEASAERVPSPAKRRRSARKRFEVSAEVQAHSFAYVPVYEVVANEVWARGELARMLRDIAASMDRRRDEEEIELLLMSL